MNTSSFLRLLSERDDAAAGQSSGFWETSVHATRAILEQKPFFQELDSNVSVLKSKVAQIEQELTSNSESGKKMREINELKKTISESEDKLDSARLNSALLAEEVKNLRKDSDPLKEKITTMKEQIATLQKTNSGLDQELKNKMDQNFFGKQTLDALTAQYSQLLIERDRLEKQIMKLKEREIELRNEPFLARGTPTVDLSQFKVPLPCSQNPEKGEDDSVTESVEFLKTLKQQSNTQKHSGAITSLCFANTQPYFASGSEDTVVNVVKTDNFLRIATLKESPKTIMSIAFSPSDRMMITAAYDGGVRFYRTPDFKIQNTNSDNRDCVNDAAFITEEKFVTCCRDQTIKLFDINHSAPITSLTAASTANSIFPMQGESLVITAHHDGHIRGYDLRANSIPFEIRAHKKQVIQVCGRIGGTRVISLSSDKTIANIDIRARVLVGSIGIQQAGMPSEKMQMALIDSSVIVGSTCGDIFDYDLSTYQLRASTKAHEIPVFCVASNQALGLLATGDKSGVVKFWDH